MKKSFCITLFFLLWYSSVFSHGEGVHQHMVREAYKLLKYYVGQDIREMKDHIGYNEQGNGQFNPGGLVVIGAYQEDHSDATNEGHGFIGWMVTNTHFWDPDQGDYSTFNYAGNAYSNAYQKARKYIYGGYELRGTENKITDCDSIRKAYIYSSSGLFEYFSIGVGYQISKIFSISLKHANTWVPGHGGNQFFPPYGSGLGLETKYFTDLWIFNNISFNYIYYLYVPNIYEEKYGIKPKGNYYEINFGKEKISVREKEKWQIFWSFGLGVSFNKNYEKTLILPSIKIGINHNIF